MPEEGRALEGASLAGALLAVALDAVLVVDADGRVRDANPAAERTFGREREDLLGLAVAELLHPRQAGEALVRGLLDRVGAEDAARTETVTGRRGDGSTFPAELGSRATGDADAPMVLHLHDASGRETVAEAQTASDAEHHLLAELHAESVSRFRADGTYVHAGRGDLEYTGHAYDELVGRSCYDFFHPDDVPGVKAVHAKVLEDPEPRVNTFRFRHVDGHYVWLESAVRGVRDAASGEFVEIQTASRRLTERRQLERALRVAEERFGGAFEHAPIGMALVSLDARFLRANGTLGELTGRSREELDGLALSDVCGEEEDSCLPPADDQAGEPIRRIERRIRRPDGDEVWLRLTTSWVRGVDGAPLHALLQAEDIGHEKSEREAFNAAVLNAIAAQTAVLDPSGAVVAANRAWEAEGGAAVGTELVAAWRDAGTELWPAAEAVEAVLGGAPGPFRLDHPVGAIPDRRWMSLTVVGLDYGGRRGAVVSRTDITGRKHAEAELERRALRDGLTGLANRVLLLDRLELALQRRHRRAGSLAVVFVDVDRFKLINDTQGHAAGDSILVAVARRLERLTRPSDTVARLGGDEFAVLCEDITDEAHAGRLAARIVDGMRDAPIGSGFSGVSVGIALSGDAGQRAEDLLRDADVAMYRAKERGRGRYEVFDAPMRERILRRLRVEDGLRGAVAGEQLRLVYQPVIELDDGRWAGAEALLRWEHPELGEVPPLAFIGVAEETGLIEPIGAWVLERACAAAAGWVGGRELGLPFKVGVNVSGRQVGGGSLVEAVDRALERSGLAAEHLALELTEGTLIQEGDGALATLSALRGRGVTLLIDDFGTGYSSLGYLKRFPIDALKVDRSFVAQLGAEVDGDATIVQAIVSMAHALGMEVIGEGVETEAQLEWLRGADCRFGQGFLLGRPLEADVFAERLAAQAASG